MSNTNTEPKNSSHIPQAGARLPGPRISARVREEDEARHGPVIPPNSPLPQAGHTMDRAQGAAKQAGPTGSPMTTGMLSRSCQESYLPRQGSRDTCTTVTDVHLLRED